MEHTKKPKWFDSLNFKAASDSYTRMALIPSRVWLPFAVWVVDSAPQKGLGRREPYVGTEFYPLLPFPALPWVLVKSLFLSRELSTSGRGGGWLGAILRYASLLAGKTPCKTQRALRGTLQVALCPFSSVPKTDRQTDRG